MLQAPSGRSVFVEIWDNQKILATATGFIATIGPLRAFITNRHVVTGLAQTSNEILWGNIPDKIILYLVCADAQVVNLTIPLVDENYKGIWTEHPNLGENADLVALPLPSSMPAGLRLNEYDLQAPQPNIAVGPSDQVSIVGFPFGIRASGLPIWSTGFIASELELNYDERPVFLIDSRTRAGQSGSPVIAHRNGGMVAMADGSSAVYNGPVTRLLGIYSGRINSKSDLGIVWKIAAVVELMNSMQYKFS
jgi:hypothetical protein